MMDENEGYTPHIVRICRVVLEILDLLEKDIKIQRELIEEIMRNNLH